MKQSKRLKLNNKGAGIITVLVAILFLTAFGSVLLMLSYTGFEMRTSDRKGKENLYDASSIMEQINAGMQGVCSEAIVNSYGDTLIKYNAAGVSVTREFQVNYRKFISSCKISTVNDEFGNPTIKWVPVTSGSDAQNVIYKDASTGEYRYHLSVIREMVEDRISDDLENNTSYYKEGSYKIYSVDENGAIIYKDAAKTQLQDGVVTGMNSEIVMDEDPEDIVLKGVCVEYTNKGRTTRISSDIILNYPKIGYSNNIYKESGINSHACIVKGSLKQVGGMATVYGSAYFGGVDVSAPGNLTFSKFDTEDSRFVIDGDIVIKNIGQTNSAYINSSSEKVAFNQRFNLGENSEVWTRNINVETQGTASFAGKTNVANDLMLNGSNSKVYLSGEYYGFGNGLDENGNPTKNAADYSAIISNQRKANGSSAPLLDMTGLDKLTIAGIAFVGGRGGYYQTAESITSRENQRIYLLPAELVSYNYPLDGVSTSITLESNPQVMSGDRARAITTWHVADAPMWKNSQAKPSDYGIKENGVLPIYENSVSGTGQMIVYAFAKFSATDDHTADENANRFFRDYFKFNSYEASKYVFDYIQVNNKANDIQTVGSTFYDAGGNKVALNNYLSTTKVQDVMAESESMKQNYAKLCTSLNQSETIDEEKNPLNYIVSEDLENMQSDFIDYRDENGKIVAVAAKEDVTIKRESNGQYSVTVGTRQLKPFFDRMDDLPCLIVTTKSVILNGLDPYFSSSNPLRYNGLIVAEGSLELKGYVQLNRDPTSVTEALVAKSTNGETITDILENQDSDEEKVGAAWVVTDLVTYDNWSRSTDEN